MCGGSQDPFLPYVHIQLFRLVERTFFYCLIYTNNLVRFRSITSALEVHPASGCLEKIPSPQAKVSWHLSESWCLFVGLIVWVWMWGARWKHTLRLRGDEELVTCSQQQDDDMVRSSAHTSLTAVERSVEVRVGVTRCRPGMTPFIFQLRGSVLRQGLAM